MLSFFRRSASTRPRKSLALEALEARILLNGAESLRPAVDMLTALEIPCMTGLEATITGGDVLPNNDIVIAGNVDYAEGTQRGDFDQVIGSYGGNGDGFVACISEDGTVGRWIAFIGGSEYDRVKRMNVDDSGTIWITGSTNSTDFPGAPAEEDDLPTDYIATLSSGGGFQWSHPMEVETEGVTQMGWDGVIYRMSSFYYQVIFTDDGAYAAVDIYDDYDADEYQYGLAQFTSGGDMIEVGRYGDANTWWGDNVGLIGADTVVGYSYNSTTKQTEIRFTVPGGYSSAFVSGQARDAYLDDSNNIIVAGTVGDYGEYDTFVAKISPAGSQVWYETISGSGNSYVRSVTADSAGNVYVMGTSDWYGVADWPFLNPLEDDFDAMFAYVASFTAAGEMRWNTGLYDGGWEGYGDDCLFSWGVVSSDLETDSDNDVFWTWWDWDEGVTQIRAARLRTRDSSELPQGSLAWPPADALAATQELNERQYIEVDFDLTDADTVDGDELAISGPGAGSVSFSGIEQVDEDTWRYLLDGVFELGPVTIEFLEDTFTDDGGIPAPGNSTGFTSMPKLDPLQLLPAGGEFVFDEADGVFRSTGTTVFGLLPSGVDPFVPAMEVVGTVEVGMNQVVADGTVRSLLGPAAPFGILQGQFHMPIGEAKSSFLADVPGAGVTGFDVVSLDVGLFTALGIGGSPTAPQVELQASLTMPDELGGVTVAIADPHAIVLSAAGTAITGGSFAFPDVDFSLLGLLDVEAENLMVEYTAATTEPVAPAALKLRGTVVLPQVWNLTADFSLDEEEDQDNYIEIVAGAPLPTVNVVGTLALEDLVIVPELWEIKEAKLTLDTTQDLVRGDATITVPPGITIIGGLGFLNGELDYIRFGVDDLNTPIGVTGAFLQKIAGDVSNLAPDAQDPVLFGGDLGLTAGPSVTVWLPEWAGGTLEGALVDLDIRGEIDIKHLTGEGTLEILGGLVTGTADDSELNWDEGFLTVHAQVKALADAISAGVKIRADTDMNLTMSGDGSLTIPEAIPLWGDTQIGSAQTLMHFSNDDNYANDLLASWGETTISAFGTSVRIVAGIRVNFDGSWQLIGAKRLAQLPVPDALPLKGGSPVTVLDADYASDIEPGADWLMMNASWETASADTGLVVEGPDGTVYDEAAIAANPDMEIVAQLTGLFSRTVIVRNPAGGTWQVGVDDATGLGAVTCDFYRDAPGPQAAVTGLELDHAAQTVDIDYEACSSGAGAVLNLYFDTDDAGADGSFIASDLPVPDGADTLSWDISGVAPGTYYVYAVVYDDAGLPAIAYSAGSVEILDQPPTVEVAFGDGGAKAVLYTDTDGTAAQVQLKGAQGTLNFTGTDILVEDLGSKILVSGIDVELYSIGLTGTSAGTALTMKAKGGLDGIMAFNSLTADGDLKQVNGKGAVLTGDMDVTGTLAKLMLTGTAGDQGTITVGAPATDGPSLAVKMGAVSDLNIDSATPIKSLAVDEWTDTDAEPDGIAAPWMKALKTKGDFDAAVNVAGDLGAVKVGGSMAGGVAAGGELRAVSVKGNVTGALASGGDMRAVKIGGSLMDTNVDVGGELRALVIKEHLFDSSVTAGLLRKVMVKGIMADTIGPADQHIQAADGYFTILEGWTRTKEIIGDHPKGIAECDFGGVMACIA